MKKLIFAISFLLIGIVIMASLYFSNLQRSTNANDLALNAVSANAGLVISFDHDKSFYEIMEGQELLQQIIGKTKSKQLHALYTLLNTHRTLNEVLYEQKIYMAFLPGTKKETDLLLCMQLKQLPDLAGFGSVISTSPLAAPLNDVFKLTFTDSTLLYIGNKGNLAVLSGNPELVHHTLRQPAENNDFAAYIKKNSGVAKNNLITAYVNFERLHSLLKPVMSSPLNGELEVLNQKQTYATLHYNFSAEKVLWNGEMTINHETAYYRLFTDLPDQTLSLNTILPQTTANYTIYAVNDYKSWKEKLDQWLEAKKEREKLIQNEIAVNKKYGLDLQKIFPVYFKNQFITFQLASGEKFGGIALTNGEKVNQLLLDLSATYAPDIKIFREAGLPYAYFGEPFKKFDKPYYTILDNYLVMANYPSSIQVFLNQYRNNQLLINNKAYQRLNNQLSGATLSFYIDRKNSETLFSRNLNMPYFRQYQADEGFGKFDGLSLQLSGNKGKFLTNLLLLKENNVLSTDSLSK